MQPAKLYALLVAINDYQPPIPLLNGCVNDLEKVNNYLHGQSTAFDLRIKKLINSEATKAAVVGAFMTHLAQATLNDVVFFYFSGHGTQEDAATIFWQTEADRKLEALVCYDSYSRTASGAQIKLLADKELRYLIHKVSKTTPHIISIFDCCHSGGNTRNGYISQNNQIRERRVINKERLSRAFPSRDWKDFIFADEISIDQAEHTPVSQWLQEGSHVQMAACQDDQSAFEVNGEGVFTKNLIDILDRCRGEITYFDLQSRIHNHIKNQFDQTPKIYACGADENILFRGFLNRPVKPTPVYGNISFNPSQGWIMDLGSMHGICSGTSVRITSDADHDELVVKVAEVFNSYCLLEPDTGDQSKLDKTKDYHGYQEDYKSSPLGLYLDQTINAQRMIVNGLKNQRNLNIVPEAHQADYCLEMFQQQIQITRPQFQGMPLVPKQKCTTQGDLGIILNYLDHISQYEFVKNLYNPNSYLFQSDPVEVFFIEVQPDHSQQDLAASNGAVNLDLKSPKQLETSRLKIKVRNRYNAKLYVALLYLTYNFGVKTKLFDQVVQGLDPNREAWAFNGETIGLSIEPEVIQQDLPKSTSYLKLIACTEDFKDQVTRFELPDLPGPLEVPPATRGMNVDSYNPGTIQDWTTRLYTLNITNPHYRQGMVS